MFARLGAWIVSASLAISAVALAADNASVAVPANTPNQGALASGQPAGVKQAQSWSGGHQLLWLLGGGVVVGGVVLVATGNGHGHVTCALPGCTPTQTSTTNR